MKTGPTARHVAEWMLSELERVKTLYQQPAVHQILQEFGQSFVYTNEHGNLAISRDVLREFRALTEGKVVWSRSEQYWRFKEAYDGPARMTS